MTEQMLCKFDRKTSRRIYGPIQDKETGVLDGIMKFITYKTRMGRPYYNNGRQKDSKKVRKGKLHKTSGKTKNKMGGRHPEGHITDPKIKRMEEMSRRVP